MPLSALTNTAECRKTRFGKTGRATNGAPAAAAGVATLTVGALADTVEHVGGRLVAAFRERYPHVQVTMVEADLGDPTAGLRAGLVDVALTRTPFDETGITTAVVSTEAVGVVVRTDDPSPVRPGELADHATRTPPAAPSCGTGCQHWRRWARPSRTGSWSSPPTGRRAAWWSRGRRRVRTRWPGRSR